MPFESDLQIALTLSIKDKSHEIPGGQVKRVALRLSSWGFTCTVEFTTMLEMDDAALYTAFQKPDIVKATLSIGPVTTHPQPKIEPVVVTGLVRTKRLSAMAHGKDKKGVQWSRRYAIEFADAAAVLWKQHRPVELYTQKKLSDVFDAHKGSHIALAYNWDVLKQERALICLGVGDDDPQVTFYDYMLWLVDSNAGVVTWDPAKNKYTFAGEKKGGKAVLVDRGTVGGIQLNAPAVIRHSTRVLNASTLASATKVVKNKQAATGVNQDVLVRTPIAKEQEKRESMEKMRLRVADNELRLDFSRWPVPDIRPGALLRTEKGMWSAVASAGRDFRVYELSIATDSIDAGVHDKDRVSSARHFVHLSARLEQAADTVVRLPPFRAPRWPIHVEGKMRSPGGEATDRIYMLVEDKKTSVLTYQVDVPLWNKTVSVPATPHNFSGEFYFPPYKNERVVVALFFDRAELHRYVDWGQGVRMPQDGQGDQTLLGKNAKNQTQITHDYQDGKPVWLLKRFHAGDHQTWRMKEGNLFLQVMEDKDASKKEPTFDLTPLVEAAKADGRWDAAYDGSRNMAVPPELAKALSLAKNRKAKAFFETLDAANRYAVCWRVQTAKKPETKAKRVETLVAMLARGEKLH